MGLLKNQKQIKLLLILILTSFLIIFYFETNVKPNKIEINQINSKYLNKVILIEGKVSKQGESENNIFLEIIDEKENKINGIIFEKLEIEELLNKKVEIIGKVSYYNKEYNLIIYEIKSQNQFEII